MCVHYFPLKNAINGEQMSYAVKLDQDIAYFTHFRV